MNVLSRPAVFHGVPSRLGGNRRTSTNRAAYTLVEVVVSSLLVGGLLAGALNVVGGVYATERMTTDRFRELQLAKLLLVELTALPYEDPQQPGGPIGLEAGENGTSRSDFDDVDDYHSWDQLPPQAKDGSLLAGAAGWRRVVSVVYIDPLTGASVTDDLGAKKITVSVIGPAGEVETLEAIRSKWGALEQRPDADAEVVTAVEIRLQADPNLPPVATSAMLRNHAAD